MFYYLLGLGSNLNPQLNINKAIEALSGLGNVVDQSPVLTTPPVGDTFHHEFCNQLVILQSEIPPPLLKHRLQMVEVDLGREPKSPARKTKDRTIDIDIMGQADNHTACRNLPLEEPYYQRVKQQWHQTENV
ncbi:MAG: 2-amino-4-hydroxy-6-hydroxymethyldihydropteridine diphosphokinase [Oleibacter sp.]|nr:2-amino-4-hydroxy-6-hydroxymethyldihydropteridine diphosphokinase [Thalassolituus sp.]